MSSFNYRVMRHGDEFAIHEVFYDENGNVNGWSLDPLSVFSQSVEDLRHELGLYLLALDKPVIDFVPGNGA